MISEYELFFGFGLSDVYKRKLENVPSEIRQAFIQAYPDYLQMVDYKGVTYLGKALGQLVDFSSLENIQAHIYSLLRKLVQDYPYEDEPLTLLPIKK